MAISMGIPEHAHDFLHKLLRAGILWKYSDFGIYDPPIKENSSEVFELLKKIGLGTVGVPIKEPFIYMPYMTYCQTEYDYVKTLVQRRTKYLYFMAGESMGTLNTQKEYFAEHGKLLDIREIHKKLASPKD